MLIWLKTVRQFALSKFQYVSVVVRVAVTVSQMTVSKMFVKFSAILMLLIVLLTALVAQNAQTAVSIVRGPVLNGKLFCFKTPYLRKF